MKPSAHPPIHLSQQGLTLMELLLAAVLVGLVGLSFVGIYATSQRYLIQSSGLASTQGQASYGMEHIRRKVVKANRIVLLDADADGIQEVAFRFDLDGGDGNRTGDDQWAGYSLDGAEVTRTLNYYDLGAVGRDPDVPPDFRGDPKVVARDVLPPGADPDDASATIPALFQLPDQATLVINLITRQTIAGDIRRTRLTNKVVARGVPRP